VQALTLRHGRVIATSGDGHVLTQCISEFELVAAGKPSARGWRIEIESPAEDRLPHPIDYVSGDLAAVHTSVSQPPGSPLRRLLELRSADDTEVVNADTPRRFRLSIAFGTEDCVRATYRIVSIGAPERSGSIEVCRRGKAAVDVSMQ
jgi:hypothetical protein